MKKIIVLILVMVNLSMFAQDSFDITSYTSPKDWKKENTESAVQFTKQDDAKGIYCIITLMKAIPGTANSKENFDAAWETVVKEMVAVSAAPTMQAPSKENGWEVQSGYAPFEADGSKGIALLVTSSGFQKMVNILILTNTDVYEKEMETFLGSVSFTKPAGNSTINNNINTQPLVKPAVNTGYTFNTTNFDNGWTSTVQDDYILVTKGNIKVYLSYIDKFDAGKYSGTGLEARHDYWDTYVSKYFITGQKIFDKGGALSNFSQDFIEGPGTDRQTGESRYIGMIINFTAYAGRASIIIASAPTEQELRRQFPGMAMKYPNDLLPMYSYNKFAVSKNDLIGKWSSSGGGTMNWYSTTTGQNVGATGAVKGDVFIFNSNNTYTSEHNGATGWVGSMNTYQQKYNGAYTVSNWQVTATKRWDGKTETFGAWFEVLKGGRVLHFDSNSITYNLFKE